MALSMLVALITAPALLATSEAVTQGQKKDRREAHRARRCHLTVKCLKASDSSHILNDNRVVLHDGRLYVETEHFNNQHPYTGYFLPYPDTNFEGLVTSICDDPPIMNWVYVDKDTYQLRYGVRVDAEPNITEPFDCTRQDRRLIFEGWEGFVVVQESDDRWALFFDRDDDGLTAKFPSGTRILEVELWRKEKQRKCGEAEL